jgi:uncharacterized membrane protein YdjX (TVP38/TMEM64 family)
MSDWLVGLVARLGEFGPWGPVIFVGLYVLAALTLAPAIVLTLTAGALFGVVRGSLLVYIGAMLGAIAAYAVSMRLSRLRVFAWMDHHPRVAAVRSAVAGRGPWVQFLLRLSPIVPFTWLNYALGLSRVPFRDFLIASFGMIPAIIVYTYYGKVVGDVTRLAAGVAPPRGPLYYAMLALGVVTTVLATTSITRAAREAMAHEVHNAPGRGGGA